MAVTPARRNPPLGVVAVGADRVLLTRGPTKNGHRPAINALFRSAAIYFGPHSVAVLMSGVLDDEVLGAEAVRSRGGTTVVHTAFGSEALGPPSGYTCPDCNGSLMTVSTTSYRCHVGHAWTAAALLEARDDEVEGALWIALRSLQEKAKLSRRLADNVGGGEVQNRYTALAEEAERAMEILGKRLAEPPDDPDQRGVG